MLTGKPCRWKRIRGIVLVVALLACVWTCHPAVLRAVARVLVVDGGQGGAEYVWIRTDEGPWPDGDRSYDRAAGLYREDTSRRILLMEPLASRVVRIGVLSRFEPVARRQLAARGVPEAAVTLLDGEPETPWDEARLLGTWMNDHPHGEVLLLCDRLESRRRRLVLDTVLGPTRAGRVGILALRDRRFDETNWWKSRCGAKCVFNGYVRLAYARRYGDTALKRECWDPDEYERMLQAAAGEGQ
ncbi:MAG: hypothetical protein HQ582_27010 [Planctomycetes bacterium]|nr:hypothetical protein [Planctomycetota bacterium]